MNLDKSYESYQITGPTCFECITNNLFVFQNSKSFQIFQNLFLNLIYNVFTEQCLLSPYIESSYLSNRSTILNLIRTI